MNDLRMALLTNRERRLSVEIMDAICGWLDDLDELGPSVKPPGIFYRFIPQLAGTALERSSRALVRLVVKAHVRGAGWIHDFEREGDWSGLSIPVWVCRKLGIEPGPLLVDAASEFGGEFGRKVEERLAFVDELLAQSNGPLDHNNRYVAVRLVGGGVDLEPLWDREQHDWEVDYVARQVDSIIAGAAKMSELDGPEVGARRIELIRYPELDGMTWFGGRTAPSGMAIWDDTDLLADHRPGLDQVARSGLASSLDCPAEVAEAYVREMATDVARSGSVESLRYGLAVASLLGESMMAVMGHAVWWFEGVGGQARVDQILDDLPAVSTQESALRGLDLVCDRDLEGVVLTGLYTGLKYSAPFERP